MAQVSGRVTDSSIRGWIADVIVGSQALSTLTDTSVAGATNNQVLSWNGTYWVPVTNVAASGASIDYVDGSIATAIDNLDASIILYVDPQFAQLDASIIRIDASLGAGMDYPYVDGSIATAIDAVDSSLVTYTDSAISTAIDNVDSSLVTYTNTEFVSKSGDTMSGALNTDSSIFLTSQTGQGLIAGLMFGDGDMGIYRQADNWLALTTDNAVGPTVGFYLDYMWGGSGNTWMVRDFTATDTSPNMMPNSGDQDTGLGWGGANQLSLIAGATEGMRISNTWVDTKGNPIKNLGTPVDSSDATNRFYVDNSLNVKADLTYVDTSLNAKASFDIMRTFNGAIVESHTIDVSTTGTQTFAYLTDGGVGTISLMFDGSAYDFTVPASVGLTAGSDASPTRNWVYIPKSTKVLTNSTSSYPTNEQFIPVADVLLQTDADAHTDGIYKVHAWTDHLSNSVGQGHLGELNKWIRSQHATWVSGVVPTFYGSGTDALYMTSTAGTALQLHSHAYPAFDSSVLFHVINDEGTPYTEVTNIADVVTDTTGASLLGRAYSLTIWASVSEDARDCRYFINKPSGSYLIASPDDALSDPNNYSNFNVPDVYKGTGFLVHQLILTQNIGGTIVTNQSESRDLRGQLPGNTVAGSGTSTTSTFADNAFTIYDAGDDTRIMDTDMGNITAGNTRTLIMADKDIDLGAIDASLGVMNLGNLTDVDATAPSTNQVLTWSGSAWAPDDVSAAGSGTSFGYVDGSLAARDAEIAQLDASIIRIDASLGLGVSSISALTDTSIVTDEIPDAYVLTWQIDSSKWEAVASAGGGASVEYVDGSLAARDAEIAQLDASIIRIDASLGTGGGATSLAALTDTSIVTAEIPDAYVLTWQIDTSKWEAVASAGGGPSVEYVDGSLAARDAEIDQLDASVVRIDASISDTVAASTLFTTFAYTDGSLATRDTEIARVDASVTVNITDIAAIDTSLNDVVIGAPLRLTITEKTAAYTLTDSDEGTMIDASGTWTLTLPDSVATGYQIAINNMGVDTITLDASTLYTADGSVNISDQYGAASATHKGSGVWYAWGKLTS